MIAYNTNQIAQNSKIVQAIAKEKKRQAEKKQIETDKQSIALNAISQGA